VKFVIIIEQDEEGVFVVECPSILRSVSQCNTDKKP
jgi:predicted RNase H-like HicB family nuclease